MKNLYYIIFILFLLSVYAFPQDSLEIKRKKAFDKILQENDTTKLKELKEKYGSEYAKKRKAAMKWAKRHNLPIVKKLPAGGIMELQRLNKEGKPVYYITYNVNAAKTVSTNKVQPGGSSGLNLTGSGIDIGIWDGGLVYEGHNSLYPQVELIDTDSIKYDDHSTHVAGTMIANSVVSNAKGMAPNAKLFSYQWNNGFAEMTTAAISIPGVQRPMILSNHSYGLVTGWKKIDNDWVWFGSNGEQSDHNFGYYDSTALALDALLYNAPFYTSVWAAGNDRGEGPELGTPHKHADSSGTFTDLHQKDGGSLGFDCISGEGLAKNIITVGAVDDIVNGYQGPTSVKQQNTNFSSWDPTDDGRIKPDIVANGDELYSTVYYNKDNSGNVTDSGSFYDYMSGTSMAAPNVTGSLALLQEYYQSTHTQGYMKASTLKALVIHTADEAGDYPGPDFKFGWGLLNTNKAAEIISLDANVNNTIQELQLQNGQTYTLNVKPIGQEPLKVTIAWTDPPAQSITSSVLVNDLDLKIVQSTNNFYPWHLDSTNPDAQPTNSDNDKDNVEQIIIDNPIASQTYQIQVSHKGNLTGDQNFSMIITGLAVANTVLVKQVDKNNTSFGSFFSWSLGIWYPWQSPQLFTSVGHSSYTLKAHQDFIPTTYQKFNYWLNNLGTKTYLNFGTLPVNSSTNEIKAQFNESYNVTIQNAVEGISSINGGTIKFADPWLNDFNESPYGIRNQGISAPFKTRTSPFNPDYSTSYGGDTYKGVFLNQDLSFDPNISNYSVQAPQTQIINGVYSYFQNWSATGAFFQDSNSTSTGVVFTSSNATVKATYKGTNISNTANTFSNNSQKKVIQPYLGPMYKVYTSLNHVWLEKSNNGTSWSIIGGSPVDNSADGPEAKNPSIDYADLENLDGADIYITYQQKTSNGKYKIKLVKYKYDDNQNEFTKVFSYDVHTSLNDYATEEATPVIAAAQTYESSVQKNKIVMVWKEHSNGSLSGGLYYRGCKDLGSTVSWDYSTLQKVTGTSNSNSNPTMDVLKTSFGGNVPYFHLAYQYSNTKIKYCRLAYGISGLGWIGPEEEPSYGTGITLNYLPSITVVNYFDDQNYIYDSPKLTWVASFGSQDWFAELRDKTNSTYNQPWNTIHHYYDNGNVINKVNINKTVEDDLFAFVFSAANNDKYVKSSNLSSVQTLSTQVTDLQISNGQAGWSGMNIIAYNNSSLPYSFSKAATIFMKSNQTASSEGRAGCVMKGNSQFYFSIADIELDGKEIQFKDKNDTIRTETSVELNKYLETKSFLISDNSELTYVISYGISDSLQAYNELKRSSSSEKFINFRVELVDNNTDKVLGAFNEINQIKESIKNKRNQYYKAKLSSGSSQVRLRIVEEDNLNGEYAFAKVHRLNNKNIAKVNFNEITLSNNASVTEYALNQNYPNPFNPSTTINYQIPTEGFVTLKIYDVLGKEVTTLVNEFETKGRYSTNFNAESTEGGLASGVYIYQLKVNSSKGEDFSSTKKLLLMK